MSLSRLSQQIMRAIRVAKFGGPENLKLETNIPIPTPAANEILIKVQAAGVNPVDTYIRSGTYSRVPTLPYTPGQDSAGVVEDVGPGVTKFKKGDRVLTMLTTSGAYAEYATTNVQYVARLDDKLSFEQGAGLGVPYYTAYKALYFRAQAKPGETVLVHGASGAVGIAAVQIAKANGHRVIGTAGTKEGLELVKRIGADLVFNHRETGYMDEIQKAQKNAGVDVILEMVANINLDKDLDLLAKRGRVVIIGCRGEVKIDPRKTMFKESSVLGISLLTVDDDEWKELKEGIEKLQKKGQIQPVVSKEYKLDEAAKAQTDILENTGTVGKLVIDTTK
ncbi:unnamed protein product [Lymnaea stagnalis]|uniref:Enoyl reductase (ER) domain-containing protein n=1 Tax=Lymnaea stagnalis TaxID=6523 RepID=A0AAV2H940_LYMST